MNWLSRSERRIFAYSYPVDMRNGFIGLQGLVCKHLKEDPTSGDVFVFVNRTGKLLKCLLWDRTGYVVIAKKLEHGKFELFGKTGKLELDPKRLALLFDGYRVGGRAPKELHA